jgi:hypothetical protein
MQINGSHESPERRPLFLPPEIDWEGLPAEVRAAIDDVVTPIYQCYVVQNRDVLQRSTAMSLVCLTMWEVIEHVAAGRTMFAALAPDGEVQEDYQRRIDRMLRLVGAKQRCTNLLIRLQSIRDKSLIPEGMIPAGGPEWENRDLVDQTPPPPVAAEQSRSSHDSQPRPEGPESENRDSVDQTPPPMQDDHERQIDRSLRLAAAKQRFARLQSLRDDSYIPISIIPAVGPELENRDSADQTLPPASRSEKSRSSNDR